MVGLIRTIGLLGLVGAAGLWIWETNFRQAAAAAPASAPAPRARESVRAEGRISAYPGAEIEVGSSQGGAVASVLVSEKDVVRKGQVLVELDSSEERAALAEAKARRAEAESSLRYFESEVERIRPLWTQKVAARQELDRSTHERDAARARKDVADAVVRRLEAALAKHSILAPIDGSVLGRYVQPGEVIEPGSRLVSVADLAKTRIEAQVDEYDVGRVRLGSAVRISAEGWGGRTWKGVVEEIPDSVVARSIKPSDPGRPSDTSVLLVKIRFEEPTPLKLGQRVEVEIFR